MAFSDVLRGQHPTLHSSVCLYIFAYENNHLPSVDNFSHSNPHCLPKYMQLLYHLVVYQARNQGARGGESPCRILLPPWENVLDIV